MDATLHSVVNLISSTVGGEDEGEEDYAEHALLIPSHSPSPSSSSSSSSRSPSPSPPGAPRSSPPSRSSPPPPRSPSAARRCLSAMQSPTKASSPSPPPHGSQRSSFEIRARGVFDSLPQPPSVDSLRMALESISIYGDSKAQRGCSHRRGDEDSDDDYDSDNDYVDEVETTLSGTGNHNTNANGNDPQSDGATTASTTTTTTSSALVTMGSPGQIQNYELVPSMESAIPLTPPATPSSLRTAKRGHLRYGSDSCEQRRRLRNAMDPLEILPYEICMLIFSFLGMQDLCAVTLVSHRWRDASEDHRLWREICLAELTPEIDETDICMENRDYKQLYKTKWLIRKWKMSHRRRVVQGSTEAEQQEYEEYKQLNFLFEEKILDLQEMVSYKFVFFLRLFNSPLVDYASVILWLLLGCFVVLKMDQFIDWNWGLVLIPCWLLTIMVLGSTALWWYFFVRDFMDKEFMSRCLFGWINLFCSCFSDDKIECTVWFALTIVMTLFPPFACISLEVDAFVYGLFFTFTPLFAANSLLAFIFVREIVVKELENKVLKMFLAGCTGALFFFLVFSLLRLQGIMQWSSWAVFSPLWLIDIGAFVSAFTLCDPHFYQNPSWFRSGLLMTTMVFVASSPFITIEILLCLKLQGSRRIKFYLEAFAPMLVVLFAVLLLLMVGDFHLWSRLKHFWVMKRSFKFPLREHWRKKGSLVVLD